MPFHLTFGKSLEEAKGKIDYILGRHGSESSDHTRRIEWQGWNLGKIENISDIWKVWKRHIEEMSYSKVMGARTGAGRPHKKTAVHITINEDAHLDFFSFIYNGLCSWINMEFYSNYMGLMAFHFKGVKFHAHLVVNPVPISFENGGMLRIGIKDRSWENRYYEARNRAIFRGMQKIAAQAGGNKIPLQIYGDDSLMLPLNNIPGVASYSELIRRSNDELMLKLRNQSLNAKIINSAPLDMAV